MDIQAMRRNMYKNARFDIGTRQERSRRLNVHNQKENRDREYLLRRNVVVEPTPPKPAVQETRRDKLLKWKAQKEALLLAQKAIKKPPFIIGAFQCSTLLDVTNIPPLKSTAKSTVKKAPLHQPRQVKNSTAASRALAALSDNIRVTRSRAKLTEQVQQAGRKQPLMAKPASKIDNKTASSLKPKSQLSFAPANHIFKPPINLTFPVTPDMMKRNKSLRSSAKRTPGWPTVLGVEPLKQSNSPKIFTSNTDGSPTKKIVNEELPADKPVKVSPKKRRSVRLATPKAALGVDVMSHVSAEVTPAKPEKGEENVEEENCAVAKKISKMSIHSPTPTDVNTVSAQKTEEAVKDCLVGKKISRMSIHSPTRKDIIVTSPEASEVVPAQFSPFVVRGRGADRHKNRRNQGSELVAVNREESQRAGQVEHFRSLLRAETKRLLELCDKWESIKDGATEEIPSDAQDTILGAVGQTRLLTKDKFQQFKRLVDKFEEGESSEEKMTADDLTGFWEMVQLTVSGLDDRFKKLEELKKNNWKEEIRKAPVKNPTAANVPRVRKLNPEAYQQSKSRIREAVAAAKKQRQEWREQRSKRDIEKSFDGGFFKIDSPKGKIGSEAPTNAPSTPKPRKSLLQQVLTNSANRAVKSPSISDVAKRIRVSMMGRRVSLSRSEEEQTFASPVPIPLTTAVPNKSILKSGKSAKRRTVVFKEDFSKEESELQAPSVRTTPRRSLRFSQGTTFDNSAN